MQEDQLQEGRGNNLFTVKNLIILLAGFVLGYFVKMQANRTITMGYDDYKLSQWQSNVKNVEASDENVNEVNQIIQDGGNNEAEQAVEGNNK